MNRSAQVNFLDGFILHVGIPSGKSDFTELLFRNEGQSLRLVDKALIGISLSAIQCEIFSFKI